MNTNVTLPKNNLNKILDNAQRNSEIKDLIEKSKSDLSGLIKLRKENPNNPNIAYLNIILEKKLQVCDKYVWKVDILCVDETKLDASYPNAQFHIGGYQFSPFRRDRNKHGGGKIVFVRNSIIAKGLESLEGKESDAICIEVTISKNKWCITFADRPPLNEKK